MPGLQGPGSAARLRVPHLRHGELRQVRRELGPTHPVHLLCPDAIRIKHAAQRPAPLSPSLPLSPCVCVCVCVWRCRKRFFSSDRQLTGKRQEGDAMWIQGAGDRGSMDESAEKATTVAL